MTPSRIIALAVTVLVVGLTWTAAVDRADTSVSASALGAASLSPSESVSVSVSVSKPVSTVHPSAPGPDESAVSASVPAPTLGVPVSTIITAPSSGSTAPSITAPNGSRAAIDEAVTTVTPVATSTEPDRSASAAVSVAAAASPGFGSPLLPTVDSSRPDPVSILRVTATTSTSVTVTWVSELDDRRRSFDLFVDDRWVGWIDGAWSNSHTFVGLEPGTDYRFGVTSVGNPDELAADKHYSTRTSIVARTTGTAGTPTPDPPSPTPEPEPGPGVEPSDPPVDDCGSTTEAACVSWPVGFVNAASGDRIDVNGLNIIDWFNGDWRYSLGARLAAAGSPDFNSLRVVMSWAEMQPTPGSFDPQALAHLDALIAEAEAHGFTVILDPIHVAKTRSRQWNQNPGSAWNLPAWAWTEAGIAPAPSRDAQLDDTYNCGADNVLRTGAALDYLSFLVERYADVDNVIAVDLVNEPRNSCWGSQLSGEPVSGDAPSGDPFENATAAAAAQDLVDLQVEWIDHLRSVDPDKVLIAAAMYGDFDVRALDLDGLAAHDNVMWSIHDYFAGVAPSDHFYRPDGQSAGVVNHDSERSERCGSRCYDYGVADRAARKASMGRYLDLTLTELARYELPLFIGEYGFHNSIANLDDALADKYELYEERGLARTVWVANYDQAFQLHHGSAWDPAAVRLTGGHVR